MRTMPRTRADRRRLARRAAPAALGVLLCVTACGGGQGGSGEPASAAPASERGRTEAGHLLVSDAWMPEPANPEVGVVYLRVSNSGKSDDAVTGVSTDASEDADLCSTETADSGSARMRVVEEIPVPAGGATTLVEGGYHVMVNDLPEAPVVGDEVTVNLSFASEEEVAVTVPVEPMTARSGESGSGHEHHH